MAIVYVRPFVLSSVAELEVQVASSIAVDWQVRNVSYFCYNALIMRRIAVALTKGGVGKTTTAVNLAAALARAGKSVLLVDVDTQGQAGRSLGMQPDAGLAELIMDEVTPEAALTEARPNLWLLAGGSGLAGVKRMIARQDFGGERTLARAMKPLEGRFDYIILDTAPGWDTLAVNTLFYADEILSPVSLEVLTLQGLQDFLQNVQAIQQYREALTLRYVVPTFYDRRVKKSGEIVEQLKTYFPNQLTHPVRYSVRLSEAPGYGQTIFEYAPKSTGVLDYTTIAKIVMKYE
jgi:chromosome partitioning protein